MFLQHSSETNLLTRRTAVTFAVLTCALLLPSATCHAQGSGAQQKVKVAYLYNFTRYVHWPANAFQGNKAPFVIGVMKDDPHLALLRRVATKKKAGGRRIVLKEFAAVADVEFCHLLFVHSNVGAAAEAKLLENTAAQPTLVVGDTAPGAGQGVPIRFFFDTDTGTIGLTISVGSMATRQLKADAKLLNISTVVN